MLKTLFTLCLLFPAAAFADEAMKHFDITMKNHAYAPAELAVPAGEKFRLTVKNEDVAPMEFESSKLNREKVVKPGESVSVIINALEAGRYEYTDDFNRSVTGTIVAK